MVKKIGRKNDISFHWRRNYMCQTYGLRERKIGR